jgi:hypothetical protein
MNIPKESPTPILYIDIFLAAETFHRNSDKITSKLHAISLQGEITECNCPSPCNHFLPYWKSINHYYPIPYIKYFIAMTFDKSYFTISDNRYQTFTYTIKLRNCGTEITCFGFFVTFLKSSWCLWFVFAFSVNKKHLLKQDTLAKLNLLTCICYFLVSMRSHTVLLKMRHINFL